MLDDALNARREHHMGGRELTSKIHAIVDAKGLPVEYATKSNRKEAICFSPYQYWARNGPTVLRKVTRAGPREHAPTLRCVLLRLEYEAINATRLTTRGHFTAECGAIATLHCATKCRPYGTDGDQAQIADWSFNTAGMIHSWHAD
jgi:hypothetical protein